jgi:hypothetical protein
MGAASVGPAPTDAALFAGELKRPGDRTDRRPPSRAVVLSGPVAPPDGEQRRVDTALFSMITFNSRRLFELAWGLPLSDRKRKSLFMDVVRAIDPGAAAIGITNPPTTVRNRMKAAVSTVLRGFGG